LPPKAKIEAVRRKANYSDVAFGPAYLFPLSFTQRPLWLLENIRNAGATYNITGALKIRGDLSLPAFGKAVDSVFRRHEVRRTSCDVIGGQPMQKVALDPKFSVAYVDFSHQDDAEREAKLLYQTESRKPFDLKKWPLVRLILVKCRDGEHVLVLSLHHIL